MCGIVGYIGDRSAQEVLLEGLHKLEYRGYDSAGVAIYDGNQINVRKHEGRLTNLEKFLDKEALAGSIGIGHTRWATHGKPSNENAHPHTDKMVHFAVVHNGIIENYLDLKSELLREGITFDSDTDTEVIAKMLSFYWTGDLLKTIRLVVEKLRGAYALAILCKYHPDKLIAVRNQSPLIIGVGEFENFIASDIPAIIKYTRDVYILEDGDMAILEKDNITLTTLSGAPVERKKSHINWTVDVAEKAGFDHFMIKEICEQPKAINDTLVGRLDGKKVNLSKEINVDISEIDRIHFVACGTAYHAGLIGKAVFEELLRIPVSCELASEYRYKNPIVTDKTLVIGVSQSGETADTLAAIKEAKRLGGQTLAISNVIGSSLVREVDHVLATWAGPEISVASTKAYTSQLVVIYLLAVYFAQQLNSQSNERLESIIEHLQVTPAKVERILHKRDNLRFLAKKLSKLNNLFFLGRGLDYSVALEGSLKLKEITYILSEAYAAGELKHGTLALIEEGTVVISLVTQPPLYEKSTSNIEEVKARGAYLIGLTLDNNEGLSNLVDDTIFIPRTIDLLAPLLCIVPLQLLAYYTCVERGYDVDRPRNLAKSVTVE